MTLFRLSFFTGSLTVNAFLQPHSSSLASHSLTNVVQRKRQSAPPSPQSFPTNRLSHERQTQKALPTMSLSRDGAMASSALLLSSSLGLLADHTNFMGGNVGTLVSLGVAALCSNIGIPLLGRDGVKAGMASWRGLEFKSIPATHVLYDLCWTKFLPACLVLTLLSSPVTRERYNVNEKVDTEVATTTSRRRRRSRKKKDSGGDGRTMTTTQNVISAVSVPFWIGSLGSILGCLVSAFFLGGIMGPHHTASTSTTASTATATLTKMGMSLTSIRNAIGMTPAHASIAAGRLFIVRIRHV